ncbi:HNH/endonuclease VII fold toxin-2 domain-containing protein, partial [Pseudomonas aeruginosa]
THGLMHTFQSAAAAKSRSGTLQLSNGSSISAKKT